MRFCIRLTHEVTPGDWKLYRTKRYKRER